MILKAVLFDLDDTLFDHHHSARSGLTEIYARHPCLRARPLEALEQAHGTLVEVYHERVVAGQMTLEAARLERFRQIFLDYGDAAPALAVQAAVEHYRAAYLAARRTVPGAVPLLESLKKKASIVVVSNNVLAEQEEKVAACGLSAYVDHLIVSDAVGAAKPDPRIFHIALDRAGCRPAEAVMVGDAWQNDVVGATNAGIRAVWLNRFGLPCPDDTLAAIIRSLEPAEAVLRLLG